jgi:hypothetical protein
MNELTKIELLLQTIEVERAKQIETLLAKIEEINRLIG